LDILFLDKYLFLHDLNFFVSNGPPGYSRSASRVIENSSVQYTGKIRFHCTFYTILLLPEVIKFSTIKGSRGRDYDLAVFGVSIILKNTDTLYISIRVRNYDASYKKPIRIQHQSFHFCSILVYAQFCLELATMRKSVSDGNLLLSRRQTGSTFSTTQSNGLAMKECASRVRNGKEGILLNALVQSDDDALIQLRKRERKVATRGGVKMGFVEIYEHAITT
jgi:hypothetical protein